MSQPQKSQGVLYIDGYGRTHTAIVTSVNVAHEGYITLVYVDVNAPEAENVTKVFDVPHVSDPSRQEPNPDLPSYDVNCWKFVGELHKALPSDHPAFDHPFEPKPTDDHGNIIPKKRPETEADLAAHQNRAKAPAVSENAAANSMPMGALDGRPQLKMPSWTGAEHTVDRLKAFFWSKGYVVGDVVKVLHDFPAHIIKTFREDFAAWEKANPAPTPLPGGAQSSVTIETKQYTDGSSATGPAPLPDQSPEQQAQQEQASAPSPTSAPPPPPPDEPPTSAPPAEEGQSE